MIRKLVIFIAVLIVCSLAFLPFSVMAVATTIQPSSQDSYILGASYYSNYGNLPNLLVGPYSSSEGPLRTLVQFDLSSIPLGSTVSSATLKLYYFAYVGYDPAGVWGGGPYLAYRVTESWTEGGVSWMMRDGTNFWLYAGGVYTTDGGASATVPSSFGWMNWTVTDIVKAWVEGGEPNCGFLIKATYESGWLSATWFYSREYTGNTALCPILEITYTPPTVPPVPELSLPLVMVVSTAVIILFFYKRKISSSSTN